MRSMRTLLPGVLLLVALAACGGGPASPDESNGVEPSTATSASEPAAETPAGSTGGGPSSVTDVDGMIEALTPPNSTQISRTDAGTSSIVAWESTDSVGDLKSYYILKIAELNLTVLTTTEAANTYAVAVGTNAEGTGLGATIAISNQGDVTNVLVTAATGG
jgi:hypothetical protein